MTRIAPKRLALLAAIMGSFVAGLDATVVNVALPAIERDLGGGLAGQQWVSNGYLLALGSLILIGGSLGDVLGERRVFSIGVAGFGVASLLCALAPSIEVLVAARVLQGVFGALLAPSALAVIVSAFPPDERGAAIGSWTAWSGIAAVIGPFVGGWLIDAASWRWIFAINVPFVLATLALVAIAIPPPQAGRERRSIDWTGAALCAIGLAGPVYGLIQQPQAGWSSAQVLGPILAGIALLRRVPLARAPQRRPDAPARASSGGATSPSATSRRCRCTAACRSRSSSSCCSCSRSPATTRCRRASRRCRRRSSCSALSKRFGALADRFGPRAFMGFGPLVAAAGLAWFIRMPADVDYAVDVLPGLLVFSLGLSMTVAPLTMTVLADADESNAGIASGINNAVARVAGLLAIAALGAVLAATFTASLDGALARPRALARRRSARSPWRATARSRRPTRAACRAAEARAVARAVEDASVHAFHTGIGIAAGLVALGGLLGLAGIVNPRRRVSAAGCAGGQLVGMPEEVALPRSTPAPAAVT